MLTDSELPKTFWAEALATAIYLQNRSPTKPVEGKTPYEAVYGENPNVGHLKVFGHSAYSYVPKDERQKKDPVITNPQTVVDTINDENDPLIEMVERDGANDENRNEENCTEPEGGNIEPTVR